MRRPLPLPTRALLLAAFLALPVLAGEDLAGFRTVDTAIRAEVRPSAKAAAAGQTGYLGVTVAPDAKGRLEVTDVAPGSPAALAGVGVGDGLSKLAGEEVRSPEDLRRRLQSRSPGDAVELTLSRKRKTVKVTATLAATSRPLKFGDERAFLGVQVGEAQGTEGVSVRRVTPGSPAATVGVREGDVLVSINQAPVADPGGFDTMLAERSPGDTLNLAVRREGQTLELKVQLAPNPTPTPGSQERRLWRNEVYRLAIVGIEYPDVKHNPVITREAWEESLFSKGTYVNKNSVTGQPVHGSLHDSFAEQSVGKLRVEGKVFDWVEVSKRRAEYSQGTGTGQGARTALLTEALDAVLARDGADALKDFDGVFFLYAGGRFATTRGGLYWPHRATVRHRDRSWPYFIVQEGGPRMTDISVLCHEFGHMLGLPDLYARPENPGSEGLGNWCLMSNQTGAGRPQHMSAWCKEQLGWLKPAVIDPTVKQKLILSPVAGSDKECYKVLIRPDGSEYLLLENRRKQGWDASLPADGLLIWRIVGSRPILDESHGVDGPAGPRAYLNSVPYPSGANSAYTPYTTPSSRSQLGGGLPVHITNITRHADGRISFWIGYEFQ